MVGFRCFSRAYSDPRGNAIHTARAGPVPRGFDFASGLGQNPAGLIALPISRPAPTAQIR
jgi:hypothetical protein